MYYVSLLLFVLLSAKFSSPDEGNQWQGIFIAGGSNEREVPSPYFQIINPTTKSQRDIPTRANIPQMFHMAAATFDDGTTYKIYFTGGHTADMEAVKTVVRVVHTSTTNQVSKVHNMTKARGLHTAVSLDNAIYICGGWSHDFEELSSCEKYDCTSDEWASMPPMQTKRWGHVSVAYNNKIYIFGGRNGMPLNTYILNSTEIFDPVEGSWKLGAEMPTARYSMRAVAVQDKIYICGGTIDAENPVDSCYIYDPATDKYTPGPPMAKARYGHHMVVLDGKIYIIGGHLGKNQIDDTIEEYDIANGQSTIIDMKINGARFYFSAAAVKA